VKAIVYEKYGGPEVLELKDVPKPVAGDNEVLVKIHAVSINDWDLALLDGTSFVNRLISGLFKPKKKILGSDFAGTIEEVGKDITQFKIGDEVYGDLSGQWGGFAEYVCANEKALAKKPNTMSFQEAAAIPQAAVLAVQGLIDLGKMKAGEKLLINGAGGGVGTYGIQIANIHGVETTVVDSEPKLDMLRQMGAKHTIDYQKEDFTKNRQEYDLILDTKTNRSVIEYFNVLKPNGAYVTVGGSMGKLFQFLLLRPFISLFTKKKVKIVMLKPNKDLAYINELYEAGQIRSVIDGHYTLETTKEAMELFATARHKGKVVISVL